MPRNTLKDTRNCPIHVKIKEDLYSIMLLRCMEKYFIYNFIKNTSLSRSEGSAALDGDLFHGKGVQKPAKEDQECQPEELQRHGA